MCAFIFLVYGNKSVLFENFESNWSVGKGLNPGINKGLRFSSNDIFDGTTINFNLIVSLNNFVVALV